MKYYDTNRLLVEDMPDGQVLIGGIDCYQHYGEAHLTEAQFCAIVEAGVRRMVLRDEDHAAAMMGRAILWARAQKDTP